MERQLTAALAKTYLNQCERGYPLDIIFKPDFGIDNTWDIVVPESVFEQCHLDLVYFRILFQLEELGLDMAVLKSWNDWYHGDEGNPFNKLISLYLPYIGNCRNAITVWLDKATIRLDDVIFIYAELKHDGTIESLAQALANYCILFHNYTKNRGIIK